MKENPIGIFDSGSGGLTVLDACREILPHENFVYVSDARPGGWGGLSETKITARAELCAEKLVQRGCKVIVAACNTATEVAIERLRDVFAVPFVGVEPALRPAVKAFPDGRILVLCTPATARQKKFKELLADCDAASVVVRPQPHLAAQIEKEIDALETLRGDVEHIVASENPDAVVLGCTHYIFLRRMFEEAMGEAARVFDGNAGTARRLQSLLLESDLLKSDGKEGDVRFDTVM